MKQQLRRWWWRVWRGRCECGSVIWPWQPTAYDLDLAAPIHRACGEPGAS